MRQHIATSDVIERDVRTRCNVEFAFKRCGLTQAQANRHGVNEKPEKPGEYQWEALSDQAAREIIAQNTTPYWRQDAFKQIEAKIAHGCGVDPGRIDRAGGTLGRRRGMTDYIERLRQSLPPELLELDQWVLWKFESCGGKQTKLPYNALTRGMASSTNPATWASFESAAAAYADVGDSGLGFVFSEHDPYTGVDLDHCITDGQMDPERREWLLDLDSYSEMSPSGTGVHVIVRARKPGDP